MVPGSRNISGVSSVSQIFSGRTVMLTASPSVEPRCSGAGIRMPGETVTQPSDHEPLIRLLVPMKPAAKTEVGRS